MDKKQGVKVDRHLVFHKKHWCKFGKIWTYAYDTKYGCMFKRLSLPVALFADFLSFLSEEKPKSCKQEEVTYYAIIAFLLFVIVAILPFYWG